jgi:hypothetical protein
MPEVEKVTDNKVDSNNLPQKLLPGELILVGTLHRISLGWV